MQQVFNHLVLETTLKLILRRHKQKLYKKMYKNYSKNIFSLNIDLLFVNKQNKYLLSLVTFFKELIITYIKLLNTHLKY